MTYLKTKATELCNQLGAKVKTTEDFKLGVGTAGAAAVVVLLFLIIIF